MYSAVLAAIRDFHRGKPYLIGELKDFMHNLFILLYKVELMWQATFHFLQRTAQAEDNPFPCIYYHERFVLRL